MLQNCERTPRLRLEARHRHALPQRLRHMTVYSKIFFIWSRFLLDYLLTITFKESIPRWWSILDRYATIFFICTDRNKCITARLQRRWVLRRTWTSSGELGIASGRTELMDGDQWTLDALSELDFCILRRFVARHIRQLLQYIPNNKLLLILIQNNKVIHYGNILFTNNLFILINFNGNLFARQCVVK